MKRIITAREQMEMRSPWLRLAAEESESTGNDMYVNKPPKFNPSTPATGGQPASGNFTQQYGMEVGLPSLPGVPGAPTPSSSSGAPAAPLSGGPPSGGPPSQSLSEALTRAGIDPAMHPLISGFSVAEGNNPSGVPTLGFTDSQAGTTLDQHAQALAKQIKDRQSVAGPFPHNGSPQDQASWMATVVGQNGVQSDWQGNAQPARSDYVNRVVQNMPRGGGPR